VQVRCPSSCNKSDPLVALVPGGVVTALQVRGSSSRNESAPGVLDNTHSLAASALQPEVRGSSSRNECTPTALHPFLALAAQPRVYSETHARGGGGPLDFEAVAKQARLNLLCVCVCVCIYKWMFIDRYIQPIENICLSISI
jgi:hypothetical protein